MLVVALLAAMLVGFFGLKAGWSPRQSSQRNGQALAHLHRAANHAMVSLSEESSLEPSYAEGGSISGAISADPAAQSTASAGSPSKPFDCDAGSANWKAGWSDAKKDWCCSNEGVGCEDPTASSSSSSSGGSSSSNSYSSDSSSSGDGDSSGASGGGADQGSCPVCSPQAPARPDLVIPFFERDLCKLKTTAKSLSVNDPNGFFGDVYLFWVSTRHSKGFEEDLREAVEAIQQTHRVHLIEFTDLMEFTDSLSGWHAQQVLKLKAASQVKAPYYVVLDSKNTLIRPLRQDDLFDTCNRGKIQAEFPAEKIPVPHIDWYKLSAAALGLDPPSSGYWPASITPVIFHTQTVLDMLESIGEGTGIDALCDGPLCDMFGARDESGQGATEFTMYTLWAYSRPKLECMYSVQKMEHFKVPYSTSWKDDLQTKLDEHGWDMAIATISDQAGFPLYLDSGKTVTQSQFPLKVEDLSKRWAGSLWRGMPEQAEMMTEVNLETLNAIIGNQRQAPIMFGAQPASLVLMPADKAEKATDLLVQLYSQAGLYDAAQTPEDLVECVVGLKN